jgi:hypothetical protein
MTNNTLTSSDWAITDAVGTFFGGGSSPTYQADSRFSSDPVYDTAEQSPREGMLRDLPEGFALRHPLPLEIQETPDYIWVTGKGGFLHGTGESVEAAIEDYGYALVDYYVMLQEERDRLADHLAEHLATLSKIITKG